MQSLYLWYRSKVYSASLFIHKLDTDIKDLNVSDYFTVSSVVIGVSTSHLIATTLGNFR
jgi:hypothetical protein